MFSRVNDIVNAVEQVYGIPAEELRRRGNRSCEGRQILLYLAAVHCRGRYTLSAIGEQLGPVTISGLDSARKKMASRIKEEKRLQNKVKQIEKTVKNQVKSQSEDSPTPSVTCADPIQDMTTRCQTSQFLP